MAQIARANVHSKLVHTLLLVLSLFGWSIGAAAQELPLSLVWDAPADCPDQAAVERDTRRMIARLPEDAAAHPLRARVHVISKRGRYEATLDTELDGQTGQRTLRDPRCAALARAVALVLALTLNADIVETVGDPETPSEPAPEPAAPLAAPIPLPALPAPPVPTRPSRAWPPLEAGLGLDLGVVSGHVPGAGLAGQARLILRLRPVSLELRGSGLLPRRVSITGSARGEATFQAAQVGLAACYQAGKVLSLGACAGGELAWLRGESRRVTDPATASGRFARAFGEALLGLSLPRHVSLRAALGGTFAFAPPVFALAGRGRVYRPDLVGIRCTLGAEFVF